MLFSATYGCGPCRLRFAKREACPSCGSTEVLPLRDPRARPRFVHLAARATVGELPLPRPAIVALAGLLVSVPALITRPVLAASAAAAGVLLVLLTRRPRSLPRPPPRPIRVWAPAPLTAGADPAERARVEGHARLSTVAVDAPLSGEACLVYGLRGRVGDAEIDDADGGDFDVELDSGDRVTISLEHAVVVTARTPASHAVDLGAPGHDALHALLEERAIEPPKETVTFEEVVVRAGARVAVSGRRLGGKLVSMRPRRGAGQVMGGDADAPLVVELL